MSRMADVYYEITEAVIQREKHNNPWPWIKAKLTYGTDLVNADVYDQILEEENLV